MESNTAKAASLTLRKVYQIVTVVRDRLANLRQLNKPLVAIQVGEWSFQYEASTC